MSHVLALPSTSGSEEVSALQRMRRGALYEVIAWIFLGVGFAVVFGSLVAVVSRHRIWGLTTVLAGSLFGLVLVVVGVVVALIGLFAEFIPGIGSLVRADPEFSTASTLIKLGYIAGLILTLVGAILTIIIVGIFIALVGLIFLLIGYIGIIALSFKLNSKYVNSLYLAAGIIFILSIFIPILNFIAWILLYTALGETIKKLKSSAGPTQTLIKV